MTDSPAEALRRRSKALIVVVGHRESGWSVTARREPSGPLLVASGHTIDDACAKMLVQLADDPDKETARQRQEAKDEMYRRMKSGPLKLRIKR